MWGDGSLFLGHGSLLGIRWRRDGEETLLDQDSFDGRELGQHNDGLLLGALLFPFLTFELLGCLRKIRVSAHLGDLLVQLVDAGLGGLLFLPNLASLPVERGLLTFDALLEVLVILSDLLQLSIDPCLLFHQIVVLSPFLLQTSLKLLIKLEQVSRLLLNLFIKLLLPCVAFL